MLHKLKFPLLILAIFVTFAWVGNGMYNYFTYREKPHIFITGLEDGGSYKDVLRCSLCSDNGYKISSAHFFLDGKEFNPGITKISSKKFELPFSIDTVSLENGLHRLEVEAIDSSYHQNRSRTTWNFFADNSPLKASFNTTECKVSQGKTLHIKMHTNKPLALATISFINKKYPCFQDTSSADYTYEAYIPIDCEERPNEYLLTAQLKDHVKNEITLSAKAEVLKFSFKRQTGQINVSQEKLDAEKEISMDSKILGEAIEKWLEKSPQEKLWHGRFEMPTVVQKLTTPFGEIRATSVRGLYYHRGVDIVNMPRHVVWASQRGKVIIKDRFLITGNTVVIDHGRGITTLYAHLEDFAEIEVGDMLEKGTPIGKIGKTGYASGYHLHWELRINNIPVDPIEWTKDIE